MNLGGNHVRLTVDSRLYIVTSFSVHWVTINPGISSGFLSLFYIFGDISMQSIRKSECPKELEPADRRSSVHVNLIRRNENCPEPERRHVPFQGVGRTLGSSAPVAPEPTVASIPFNSAPTPSMGLVVDETLPSTAIQLRLADGTRMIAHFNHHHTINDIRSFIDASRPGGARNYHLQMMGFPPKLLSDPAQTIEQAGLANSVVIQKF
ncbi:hypothetical protein F2P56_006723 [Juglans regia]|uniref:UBX domain-containing protein n=1 Tax=Juglans regia TaxID=51240 RepID=A0A833Y1K8_JUGRE|nr:hypothetical protein F2P56_006723 [Juglans regia]